MTKPARRLAATDLTDEEETRVQAMIARDPDNPEITDEQAAQARPFAEAFPEMLAAIKRGRGRPPADSRKVAIKLRLDPETVDAFRATGPGWQTRMNEALAVASGGRKRRLVRRAAALSPECTPQVETEMRSKVVGFVKFFSEEAHADQFIAGKLFMRRLRYFQQLENRGTDDERPDANEAVVSWHQPDRVELTLNFPGFDPITIGKDDLAGPVSTTRHFYSEMHVFCMTALSMLNPAFLQGTHEEIEAQVQAAARVDERCLDFGPHAVVVKYAPFVSQLRRALEASKYWYNANLVTYYDEQTFHGTFEETNVPFMKQSRFAHQNEYRICIQAPTPGNDPLTFNIGDMSGFAHKIKSADLNPGLRVTLRRPPGSSVVEHGAGDAAAAT